jgi:hypothetical protein
MRGGYQAGDDVAAIMPREKAFLMLFSARVTVRGAPAINRT